MDKTPQKLIFVNRYFFPDHSATSQMLSDLAFGLVEDGSPDWQIHIVTSRQRYDDPQAQLPPFEIIDGVHVHRIATTRFGRQNLLGRAIDYLSFYVSAAIKLISITRSGDTLVAKTDPPLISLVVAWVARWKQARLVNWLQDLFPEVAAQLGVKLAKGWPYRVLKALRNRTLVQAHTNIAIGELMAERLRAEGVPENQIAVIHNWADGDQLQPIRHEQNPLRKEWGLENKFVIGYSGNLGRGHDFTSLLYAAEQLKDDTEIVFLLIGSGAQLPNIQQYCVDKELKNVIFKPYQPRSKLSESLSAIDVHLVSLKPELESLIVPSKFYGIIAAGRALIFSGAGNGEIARLVQNNGLGAVVEQESPEQFMKAIVELKQQQHERFQADARQFFESRFSKTVAINHFKKVLFNS